MIKMIISACLLSFSIASCAQKQTVTTQNTSMPARIQATAMSKNEAKAVFAGGCFWCVEAVFERVKGVKSVISGYSGGTESNPTYEQVGHGATNHAEAVEVTYDPSVVSYESLLKVFVASIDPTQVNGQGPDRGRQYRSVAFYATPDEQKTIENYLAQLTQSGAYAKPLAIEVSPAQKFWLAEDYHQDFVKNHPMNPYVQHESLPRLARTLTKLEKLNIPLSK